MLVFKASLPVAFLATMAIAVSGFLFNELYAENGIVLSQNVKNVSLSQNQEKPIIGFVIKGDKTVIVFSGSNGPLYTVESEQGRTLATYITENELLARFPDLEKLIKYGVTHYDATLFGTEKTNYESLRRQ